MSKPVVALVGRPNVGKSTLFNRLAGERLAVVHEIPGTTRDRLVAETEWQGLRFDIVDTGGIDPGTAPGEEVLARDSPEYIELIRHQAAIAVQDADAILFLVDAESGLTSTDHEVAGLLRRMARTVGEQLGPPILLVANKADNRQRREAALEFYELGMGDPIPVSALHGSGTGELLDELVAALAPGKIQVEEPAERIKIAIVGRPNVGKSSLLNRLLGEERVIVSPVPGTTRDAIDTLLDFEGRPITLIDTAGIRRRGRIQPGVEKFSVLRALKAIERADVALLLLDASEGVTAQDAHIAGMILDKMKSVVLIVNKWDAIDKDTHTMDAFTAQVRRDLNFLDYVPVLFISALTGQRVDRVLPLALAVQESRMRRISTGELNRVLSEAQSRHAPPSRSGVRLRIYYAAQVRTDPPTFLFHVNDPKLVHFSYQRFLENRIREGYPFLGTPIRLSFRTRPKET